VHRSKNNQGFNRSSRENYKDAEENAEKTNSRWQIGVLRSVGLRRRLRPRRPGFENPSQVSSPLVGRQLHDDNEPYPTLLLLHHHRRPEAAVCGSEMA